MADAKLFQDQTKFSDEVAHGVAQATEEMRQARGEEREGSGMLSRQASVARAPFLESERDEAWARWAEERGISEPTKSSPAYIEFIKEYYELSPGAMETAPPEPASTELSSAQARAWEADEKEMGR